MAALALLGLAGCVPDLGEPPKPRAASSLASARTLPEDAGAWPGDGWWKSYGDPQLDRLIDRGLAGAPDVAAAAARLGRAEGLARTAAGALGPSIDVNGSGGVAKQSYNNGIPRQFLPQGIESTGNVNARFGLDLDLFGRNRATRRAALADRDAARIDIAAARLALSSAIATAYADLARLHGERDVTEQAFRIQQDSATLVALRVRNGLDTEGERRQASAGVPAARADIALIDESIALVRNQIAALTGQGPDAGLAIARPRLAGAGVGPLPPHAGIDLVGRRPDIVAARLRAEAAAQRIRAARAVFYPDVNLSALVGLQSLGISRLVDQGSSYGSAGPALSLPLFGSGRRAGDYRATRADYDASVAEYDRTLVQALREVADAVASRQSLGLQAADARASRADSEAAYRIARLRYEGGLSSYVAVLSAEQGVIAARRRDSDLAARAFALDIALVRALGGGFAGQ